MKQKVLFSLMLLCMSLCSISSWAELVRPTMPEATLESGKFYYLYNVEADLFAKKDAGCLHVNEDPSILEITVADNGTVTMKNETDYMVCDYDGVRWNSYTSAYNYGYWTISEIENSLIIQCSEYDNYYNPDQYLGWMGDNATEIQYKQPITGAIHWKLLPADDEGNRYVAALKLYKELEKAEVFVENGYSVDLFKYYTDLYASRATADINEMTDAAIRLRGGLSASQGYKAPYWNECPIIWECAEGNFGGWPGWELRNDNRGFRTYFGENNPNSSLSATVKVDEPSVIGYYKSIERAYGALGKLSVYVDGVLVRTLLEEQNGNFFEQLSAGVHKITWVTSWETNYGYFNIQDVGVISSPLISVNLLEPGSLGTEVLYNTDHIKNVRRLKIKGEMNNDDWAKIKMMHYLQDLDLSEAIVTEIPENQFSCYNDTASNFLHKLVLPEGLKKINDNAFRDSRIDNLTFPSTLTTIGYSAFRGSHIKEIILPESCTELLDWNGNGYHLNFCDMMCLEKVVLPKQLKRIGCEMFTNCTAMKHIVLPEDLEEVDYEAFKNCANMTTTFPENVKKLGVRAFNGCKKLETVTLKNIESMDTYAFEYCEGLKHIEIGQFLHTFGDAIFKDCPNIETLRLNCANVVLYNKDGGWTYPVTVDYIQNVKLMVPDHLVTSYKLDSYWYNFKSVEGFSTTEIQDWVVYRPLTLNRERLEGTPNIRVNGNYDLLNYMKINGDAAQVFNNLTIGECTKDYENYPAQIFSNCNNVTINGNAEVELTTNEKRWYFFSLPFDVKVSDITSGDPTAQKAVRYYDGANRAIYGAAGSWKNYGEEDIIPAGSGFIMQTNKTTWNGFLSFNETKQNLFATTELVKTLEVNDSETAANKGWNLVGNPWQCFFNNHYLNFTGPITVWDAENKTYKAYSLTDDDYAIRPNEAFFVQCPDAEHNTIGFPAAGRQLTQEIVNQNPIQAPMRERTAQGDSRRLVDVVLSDGDFNDQTRVVLNEEATIGYEPAFDASKMMSMESEVAQIYTLDDEGIRYAINERPVNDGSVRLGFYAGKHGTYTLSLSRNAADTVVLIDLLTRTEVDLTVGEYSFTTEAGTYNSRFALRFNPGDATGISAAKQEAEGGYMYNVYGQRISKPAKGITIRNGRKLIIKK